MPRTAMQVTLNQADRQGITTLDSRHARRNRWRNAAGLYWRQQKASRQGEAGSSKARIRRGQWGGQRGPTQGRTGGDGGSMPRGSEARQDDRQKGERENPAHRQTRPAMRDRREADKGKSKGKQGDEEPGGQSHGGNRNRTKQEARAGPAAAGGGRERTGGRGGKTDAATHGNGRRTTGAAARGPRNARRSRRLAGGKGGRTVARGRRKGGRTAAPAATPKTGGPAANEGATRPQDKVWGSGPARAWPRGRRRHQ